MFKTVLIANRGEIARRIMRTCRRLGARTVAVYSDADAGALHVAEADVAQRIGEAPARASYLDIAAVLAAAKASGAEAVHPGYGFLAENPDLAEACAAAGVVFIGPSPAAMRAMGSKSAAKSLMEKAGVPVVPGYHGRAQDLATFRAEAARSGYPILIKPVAGGGGKGMHVVAEEAALEAALGRARREAASSFADDRLLIERYIDRPRHVEVQIFGDNHGGVLHLFERECSLQRRHQKIIEEAPAPGLSAPLRTRLAAAAIAAAKSVHYSGAGTVEFLVAPDDAFWFMEMNTRLQVEHPVTEAITGLDLVEWQLRIAAGEKLPRHQDEIVIRGHAIEARLYAEDPRADFRPAPGSLRHLRLPEAVDFVRVDSSVREGDEISAHYDPMIAKIIVHGANRAQAVDRLRAAIRDVEIAGTATNAGFLAAIAASDEFALGQVDIGFIDRNRARLEPVASAPSAIDLALATLAYLASEAASARSAGQPGSPWSRTDGWQMNDAPYREVSWAEGAPPLRVGATKLGAETRLAIDGARLIACDVRYSDRRLEVVLDGEPIVATVVLHDGRATIFHRGLRHEIVLFDPIAGAGARARDAGGLITPMPGVVTAVLAEPGARVRGGTALVTIEAMKVEYAIRAPADGLIAAIRFKIGDRVVEGDTVVDFTPEPQSSP